MRNDFRFFRPRRSAPTDKPGTNTSPGGNPPPAHFADSFQDASLRAHPGVRSFSSPEALAKSWHEVQQAVGKKGLILPTEKSTPAEIRAAMTELGCPKDPRSYDHSSFKVPEGFPLDEKFVTAMQDSMWRHGITQQQYLGVFADFIGAQHGDIQAQLTAHTQATEAAKKALVEKWGAALPAKMKAVQNLVTQLWGENGKTALGLVGPEGQLLGNDPAFLEVFAQLAELASEHNIVPGGAKRLGMSPEEAKAEIEKLRADPSFTKSWMNSADPGHKAAVERMNALYALLHPNAAPPGSLGVAVGHTVA